MTSTPPESVSLELLGPDSESDLRQARILQLGQLVAFEFQCRVADLDAVCGDRQCHQVHRGRADETGDERVGRLVVELVGRGELLQLPEPQHGDSIPHRHRLDLVVGDVDGGGAEPSLQRGDLGAGLHAQFRIQVRQRLVHAEHLRLTHDRAAHRDALTLTAGQLGRLAVQELGEVQDLGRILDLLAPLVGGDAAQLQRETHVLGDGLVRVERVVLEHHRDVAVLGRHARHVLAADLDGALVDVLESGEHAQRGALARAGRTDQHDELAVLDVEVERVNGELVRTLVDAGGVLVGDRCHGSSSPLK